MISNPQVFILSIVVVLLMMGLIFAFRLIGLAFGDITKLRDTVNHNAETSNSVIEYLNKTVVSTLNESEDRILEIEILTEMMDDVLKIAYPSHLYPGRDRVKLIVKGIKEKLADNGGKPLDEAQKEEVMKDYVSSLHKNPLQSFMGHRTKD